MNQEIKKDKQNLKAYKNKVIEELLNTEKNNIKNTIQEDKNFSIWMRIKKTLGMT
jgi:hypothetical protein